MTTIEQTKEKQPPFDDNTEGHLEAIRWATRNQRTYWEEFVAWTAPEPESTTTITAENDETSEANEMSVIEALRWALADNPTVFSLTERCQIQRAYPQLGARGVSLAYGGTESIADIPETVFQSVHDPLEFGI